MPVLRRLEEQSGPAAPGDAAGPALERIVPFTFAPGPAPTPDDTSALISHMESLYGPFADLDWLTGGAAVSYHDMVRHVVGELGEALADVDLAVTVDASPDCRHQSFPAALLAELLPGEPLQMGISEQGVAGPFTALRIAHQQVRSGAARRALVLVMEQSTLPPDDAAVRPTRDVAVALLLGPDGTVAVDPPTITVTRAAPATWPAAEADLVVAGAGLTGTPFGAPVVRAPGGHPCAGVWLALAEALAGGAPPAGRVLVADADPVLPYRCAVTLTVPAARPEPSARIRRSARARGLDHPPAAEPRSRRPRELAR
ncbi:hypothetical protein KBX06_24110 [Micromonospora sp. C31]|uniref:hypothetical protein n=1 Tax=Micromonospora sp. C31 TaxID=2824876 RepID=UPI001B36C35B|nr:hypothetical protein [Micromonospora sp. C31]MBQ1076217.1 hypothetical protein [Micromonospora sp. C31]